MRKNDTKSKSAIYKLTTILVMLIEKLRGQYNFIGPVSSGKVNFRPIGEGPLAEFFSICQSATECRLMDKQTDVWVSTKLNEAYIYSAQLVKKTFVMGFASKVLDVSAWKTGDKPVERDTNPKKILKCPFTKGYRWICLNGDTGAYFTYDIVKEAVDMNFEPALAAKFGLLNNEDCAIVAENKTLFCAKIGPDTKKIIQLDSANAGGLVTYNGNLTVPDKPVGATAHKEIIGVYGVDKVQMRIGNYTTGEALFSWDKAETADSIKSVADMNWGMMIITTADKSDIVKIKDGTVLKTFKAQTAEFSEVEKSFYFVDASKNNEDSYYNFTLPPIPPNCKEYHYGIDKCLGCIAGSTLYANGTCSQNKTKAEPGSFIPISDYDIDFEGKERGLLLMSFKNLTGLTSLDRANFIKNFTNDTNFTNKFVVRHGKDSSWNVSDFMKFEPMEESMAWEEGVLPINVVHLRSMEYFTGTVGVLTNGNLGNLTNNTNGTNSTNPNNPTNATTPATPANTPAPTGSAPKVAAAPVSSASKAPASSSSSSSSSGRRFLVNLFGGDERVLQASSPTNNLSLPPFWKPSDGIKTFFRVIFDIMKFIVNLMQVYLVFVKPFSRLFRIDKWSSWFASSLQAMQIYLCLGGISGRFGGVIDAMKIEQLKSFQRNFFFDTEVNFSSDYQKISRAAILEKFEKAKYTPSPIQETFWEFLILMVSIFVSGIGMIVPDFHSIGSCFRKGATNSFMVPLVLASTGCIVTLIKTGLSNIFGVLSLIASIFLLFYFFGELVSLIRPCESMDAQRMRKEERLDYKNKLLREGSYRCYDIDSLNNFNKQRPLNFYEYFIHLLIPIFLFSFLFTGVGSILSILALMIPKLILALTQIGNRNERLKRNGWGNDVGREVNYLKTMKTADYGLKILALLTLLLFSTLLVYSNLAWTQIFTIIGLLFYFSDYLVLIYTFIARLLGWGSSLGRSQKILRNMEYKEREGDRSDIKRSRYDDRGMDPPPSSDRRMVDRSRPSSPRDLPSRGPNGGAPVRRLPPVRRDADGPLSPRYNPDVRRSRLN